MEWKTLNTIRIYETDSHARRLQARVLSCEESENGWLVELDRTIFYPTGGGQPCDMGTLGGADVTETLLRGETVLHRCTAALSAGADVTGRGGWTSCSSTRVSISSPASSTRASAMRTSASISVRTS